MFFAHRFEFQVGCLFRLLSSFPPSSSRECTSLDNTDRGEDGAPPGTPHFASRRAEAQERKFYFSTLKMRENWELMRVGQWGRDVFLSLCLSLFSDSHVTACRSGLSDASQIPTKLFSSSNSFTTQSCSMYVFFFIGLQTYWPQSCLTILLIHLFISYQEVVFRVEFLEILLPITG